MTNPRREGDVSPEQLPPLPPAGKAERADKLALDLAEEWTEEPETTTDSAA